MLLTILDRSGRVGGTLRLLEVRDDSRVQWFKPQFTWNGRMECTHLGFMMFCYAVEKNFGNYEVFLRVRRSLGFMRLPSVFGKKS